MITVYIPRDSAALSLGADELAAQLTRWASERHIEIQLIRNGSRGMLWLEPLVEVQTAQGRVGYGAVDVDDWLSLLNNGLLDGANLPNCIGVVDEHPYLKNQERLTFARIGLTDPLSLSDYAAHGGWAGWHAARALSPQAIVQAVTESGLRGRGGAAFPAGIKWNTVLTQNAAQKYIVCNADEGDSGTFSDRLLMESDPFALIEGMLIAGLSVGATVGYIYVRSEYPHAIEVLNEAIELAADELHGFTLHVRKAAGSYVCGEETALLESLEGKRGVVRAKPPLPAIEGLFGQPTVINNVITLASVPIILARGADFYRDFGMGRSRGTLPFQIAGNIAHGGLVEKAFGVTLRELVLNFGGGTFSGQPIKAIQVGGPLGTYVPEQHWDVPLDYEAYTQIGAVVGHGGIVVHDNSVNMRQLARYAMEFCAIESCGKCTPCRIGSVRGVEVIDKIALEPNNPQHEVLLRDLCDTMLNASLCAMGGMTPYPVLSALNYYPNDFIGDAP
ncbi:MAG: formate dehydrogenase beta subunit [Formosimonas sp.]